MVGVAASTGFNFRAGVALAVAAGLFFGSDKYVWAQNATDILSQKEQFKSDSTQTVRDVLSQLVEIVNQRINIEFVDNGSINPDIDPAPRVASGVYSVAEILVDVQRQVPYMTWIDPGKSLNIIILPSAASEDVFDKKISMNVDATHTLQEWERWLEDDVPCANLGDSVVPQQDGMLFYPPEMTVPIHLSVKHGETVRDFFNDIGIVVGSSWIADWNLTPTSISVNKSTEFVHMRPGRMIHVDFPKLAKRPSTDISNSLIPK